MKFHLLSVFVRFPAATSLTGGSLALLLLNAGCAHPQPTRNAPNKQSPATVQPAPLKASEAAAPLREPSPPTVEPNSIPPANFQPAPAASEVPFGVPPEVPSDNPSGDLSGDSQSVPLKNLTPSRTAHSAAQSDRSKFNLWQNGSQEILVTYTGGAEKPLGNDGLPALCDAFDIHYSAQTLVLEFDQCQGARLTSHQNVTLTSNEARAFENAVSSLQLLRAPRCPTVADAGIIHIGIKNSAGDLKNYVDSVTCGYGNPASGVLEYGTIINLLNVTRALTRS